jgi:hypothetical protein
VKLRAFIAKAHAAGKELRDAAQQPQPEPPPVTSPGPPGAFYDWEEDGL